MAIDPGEAATGVPQKPLRSALWNEKTMLAATAYAADAMEEFAPIEADFAQ